MKVLFFQPEMGAAGDMINAALLGLLSKEEQEEYLHFMNSLGLPDTKISIEQGHRKGIAGLSMKVLIHSFEEDDNYSDHNHHLEHHNRHHDCEKMLHNHHQEVIHHHIHPEKHVHNHYEHHHKDYHKHHHEDHHEHNHGFHTSMGFIEDILNQMPVSDMIRKNALAVYHRIAFAESKAYGVCVDQIHFHEVGNLDAIADIVGACYLIEKINPDRIYSSSINTGFGTVQCAHGILPVPAPATAYLLQGIPTFADYAPMELCTPTGAAILGYFCNEFIKMPPMIFEKIGYGLGKRESKDYANVLRVFLAEMEDTAEPIIKLECNLDDMSSEQIAFAAEVLFEHGARDVYTIPITMKKSRPGIILSVICVPEKRNEMVSLIFKHTSTLGIRELSINRYCLDRKFFNVDTKFGPLSLKESKGYGVIKRKFEFDDLSRIAKENECSIEEVLIELKKFTEIE